MTQTEALRLALEALENIDRWLPTIGQKGLRDYEADAITAIKAALEAKDEPVATIDSIEQEIYENTRQFVSLDVMEWMLKRYYTTPSQQEAKDEPVAWMCADESLINKGYARFSHICMGEWKIPVYTTPPQRTWVGLTDEEAMQTWEKVIKYAPGEMRVKDFAAAIEAKLKGKNETN